MAPGVRFLRGISGAKFGLRAVAETVGLFMALPPLRF